MDEWIQAIANVGFPIVAFFYIATRLECKFDKLQESIVQLTLAVDAFRKEDRK